MGMNRLCLLVALLSIAAGPVMGAKPIVFPLFSTGDNGGTTCAACTIVVGLVEQLAYLDNQTIDQEVARLCTRFPASLQKLCTTLVDLFGPAVINLLEEKYTPDVVCHALGICSGTCHVFPAPADGIARATARAQTRLFATGLAARVAHSVGDLPAICKIPGIKEICDIIDRWADGHDPLDDNDKDNFGPLETFRGADWRGRDCDDSNPDYYPGRRPIDNDRVHDSNCNGIHGVDPVTNKTYEELLCGDTPQVGVAVLGDSASAHFHIPPIWLTSTYIASHNDTFDFLVNILENELDWPQLSATTGFASADRYQPEIGGPTNSSYLVGRARNRCVHRDYQNIAVNGARAGSMNESIVQSLQRSPQRDFPLTVIYALIGNDVCNGHEDTVADMTTPEEMRSEALATLRYLDTVLPAGSKVILMGLADGRILYDALHQRIHPIGSLRGDVTYAAVYDYLNCLSISPCRGWMNANATLRNITTERAQNLSAVLNDITKTESFEHFSSYYIDNPIAAAIQAWEALGGQAWQLIEPVDGFHPAQLSQPLIVDQVWEWIAQQHPDLMPPINPHNDMIAKIFGDQGGH